MTVQRTIEAAERLLPGEGAPEGQTDPRWRAIIAVAELLDGQPQPVWEFIARWGVHPDDDLRMAIATCLLEHLLEKHFEAFFPRVQQLVCADPLFAATFSSCWTIGQSEAPENALQFEALKRQASERAG